MHKTLRQIMHKMTEQAASTARFGESSSAMTVVFSRLCDPPD
jgi:hypothetical protein